MASISQNPHGQLHLANKILECLLYRNRGKEIVPGLEIVFLNLGKLVVRHASLNTSFKFSTPLY